MHDAVSSKRETLAELCRRFHVKRLEVFGSATRTSTRSAATRTS